MFNANRKRATKEEMAVNKYSSRVYGWGLLPFVTLKFRTFKNVNLKLLLLVVVKVLLPIVEAVLRPNK